MSELGPSDAEKLSMCQIIDVTERIQENISIDQQVSEPGIVISFFTQTRSKAELARREYLLLAIAMDRHVSRTGIKPTHGGRGY